MVVAYRGPTGPVGSGGDRGAVPELFPPQSPCKRRYLSGSKLSHARDPKTSPRAKKRTPPSAKKVAANQCGKTHTEELPYVVPGIQYVKRITELTKDAADTMKPTMETRLFR